MSVQLLLAAADGYDLGSGRLGSLVALVLGLAGLTIGVLALVRGGHRRPVVALTLGAAGAVVGGLLLAASPGSIGSGDGRGGAVVAVVVGLLAVVVGALALARSRRVGGSLA